MSKYSKTIDVMGSVSQTVEVNTLRFLEKLLENRFGRGIIIYKHDGGYRKAHENEPSFSDNSSEATVEEYQYYEGIKNLITHEKEWVR
jgi:hypothetical protein